MAPAIIQMEPYRSFGVADKLLLGADLIEVGIGGQADSYLVVEASEDHPDFKIALDEVALGALCSLDPHQDQERQHIRSDLQIGK